MFNWSVEDKQTGEVIPGLRSIGIADQQLSFDDAMTTIAEQFFGTEPGVLRTFVIYAKRTDGSIA